MKYKINDDYILEAENKTDLYMQIIENENIKIEYLEESKNKLLLLSQKDYRWGEEFIGKSDSKLKNFGCTLTSISMLTHYLGDYKTPDWLARNLSFLKDKIIWTSLNNRTCLKFVYRYYARDDKKIKEILDSKNNYCLLQVNNGIHWVLLIGYDDKRGFKFADPYFKDIAYKIF